MARIDINAIRRRQIAEAAVNVIAKMGLENASIDEIAKEAGISRGLISYHFKNKLEVLSIVLERCRESYQETIYSVVNASDEPKERMQLGIRRALELIREDPINYEVFLHFSANARSHPELGEQIRALWSDFDRDTANAIRIGQKLGIYRDDVEPEVAATIINSSISGLALRWLVDPNSYPFDETVKVAEQMLLLFLTQRVTAPVEAERHIGGNKADSPNSGVDL